MDLWMQALALIALVAGPVFLVLAVIETVRWAVDRLDGRPVHVVNRR